MSLDAEKTVKGRTVFPINIVPRDNPRAAVMRVFVRLMVKLSMMPRV